MTLRFRTMATLALAGLATTTQAQAAGEGVCPQIPASSGLTWEHKAAGETQFCRALRADGSEAFGLYIARDSAFEPGRANRAEQASIDGQRVTWYRTELAANPDVRARETLLPLPGGRVAYLWIQAPSDDALKEAIAQTGELRFSSAARLSSK